MDFNICNFVNTVPQFGGTCWFNSILMASLYSKNSRKLLIGLAKNWDKKNNFLMVIKNILKNHYFNSEKTNNYFKKVRPEAILFKMLQTYNDKFLKKFLKYKIKTLGYSNLGWYNEDVIKFYKYLGVNCLDITYFSDTDEYLINFDKYFKYKQDTKNPNQIITEQFNKITASEKSFEKESEEVKDILRKIPDVIILNHSDLNSVYTNGVRKLNDSYKKFNKKTIKAHQLSTYKIKQDDTIKHYENIINFKGYKYKLDSCLIENYDRESGVGHSIVGLTCDNNRFVYNGWNINTVDAAIKDTLNLKLSQTTCSLMKFDWDLKTNYEFCLNKTLCKLDFIDKNDKTKQLCFSFNKGPRILVYIRVNETKNDETNISNISTKYISRMTDIIEDMYDIKKLTRSELIEKLINDYNFIITSEMNTNHLRNLLLKLIKRKDYKIKHQDKIKLAIKEPKEITKVQTKIEPKIEPKTTKKDLIEQIKIKYPTKKGLTAKTKDELFIIFNEEQLPKTKKETKITKKELLEQIKAKYPTKKGLTAKTKDELIEILYK